VLNIFHSVTICNDSHIYMSVHQITIGVIRNRLNEITLANPQILPDSLNNPHVVIFSNFSTGLPIGGLYIIKTLTILTLALPVVSIFSITGNVSTFFIGHCHWIDHLIALFTSFDYESNCVFKHGLYSQILLI